MTAVVYQRNKNNGTTYVYESISYWDKEKKQSRAKRKCIGKLDSNTGEVIPNQKKKSHQEILVKRKYLALFPLLK